MSRPVSRKHRKLLKLALNYGKLRQDVLTSIGLRGEAHARTIALQREQAQVMFDLFRLATELGAELSTEYKAFSHCPECGKTTKRPELCNICSDHVESVGGCS